MINIDNENDKKQSLYDKIFNVMIESNIMSNKYK